MKNILVTTMGTTWQIPPELIGFTNPDMVDLYRFHPRYSDIQHTRKRYDSLHVDELWIVTTTGKVTGQLKNVLDWHARLPKLESTPSLRVWQVSGLDDMVTEVDCDKMKEAIFRVVLHASEHSLGGRLILSLAGGRKTMSSDMQTAASLFGCHALVHVIDHAEFSGHLRQYTPAEFTVPLPRAHATAVMPLVIGKFDRNSLMDIHTTDHPSIRCQDYPIAWQDCGPVASLDIPHLSLTRAVMTRQQNAAFLTHNYTSFLMKDDRGSNFLALYHLSPKTIEQLKSTVIGVHPEQAARELMWLRRLPKAELHCHLGGVLDTADIIRVARANLPQLDRYQTELAPWLQSWKNRIDHMDVSEYRDQVQFKTMPVAVDDVPAPLVVCAFILLFQENPERLDDLIFGQCRQDAAFCGKGFSDYEMLGDIQGSRLLQSTESISETCRILAQKALSENIRHLEIRCSPVKYSNSHLSASGVMDRIAAEITQFDISFSIILTASRHGDRADITHMTDLATLLLNRPNGFPRLRGFDLAGNESACPAKEVRKNLLPLMERCLHITIHAGEDVDVSSIWQAVYDLNAERIGHGLTLRNNPELMKRVIDRNIAIEMCPSSNFQIVGYRDNYLPETGDQPIYPLKTYLDEGIKVTVNTDNPGISRTGLTHELHRAARLTPGGLSQWEILKIIRNGFKASFTDRIHRNSLLRSAETDIVQLIQEGFFP